MATGDDDPQMDPVLETVTNVLACPICLERFRDPRVLSCGHSFCRVCIEPMVKQAALCCPACRGVTPVPTVVRDLPRPYVLLGVLQALEGLGLGDEHHVDSSAPVDPSPSVDPSDPVDLSAPVDPSAPIGPSPSADPSPSAANSAPEPPPPPYSPPAYDLVSPPPSYSQATQPARVSGPAGGACGGDPGPSATSNPDMRKVCAFNV